MDVILDIENRLKALEEKIKDCRGRMPAHSVKPGMMAELMELEDDRERTMAELRAMRKNGTIR